jgi:hypothetical protein
MRGNDVDAPNPAVERQPSNRGPSRIPLAQIMRISGLALSAEAEHEQVCIDGPRCGRLSPYS